MNFDGDWVVFKTNFLQVFLYQIMQTTTAEKRNSNTLGKPKKKKKHFIRRKKIVHARVPRKKIVKA